MNVPPPTRTGTSTSTGYGPLIYGVLPVDLNSPSCRTRGTSSAEGFVELRTATAVAGLLLVPQRRLRGPLAVPT